MEHATSTIPAVETWRPVRDFEGLYEVSSLGQVRSLDRYIPRKSRTGESIYQEKRAGKIIAPHITNRGYLLISLHKEGKIVHKLLHRLVAQTFIPNPDNLPEVNHKDECKTNNRADNLEWCDGTYNKNYGTRPKKVSQKLCKPIEQLTLQGEHVAFYSSMVEAERISNGKFSHTCISPALNGKQKTSYGYIWRYVNEPITQIENGQPLSI